jgi:transcriptional regulator with XRE-family HTH domain
MKNQSRTVGSTLADRIRTARKRARISQAELARQTGVTASAVSQWEHPEGTTPDLARLVGIASATNVSLDWLVSGRERALRANAASEARAADTPAVMPEMFAHDILEEKLLEQFRAIHPKARELLVNLIAAMQLRPGRGAIQPR